MAKKISYSLGALLLLGLLALSFISRSASAGAGAEIPLWLCIPFAGLLLCVALCPLFCPNWWEKNQPLAVAFWSVTFLVPFGLYGGLGGAVAEVMAEAGCGVRLKRLGVNDQFGQVGTLEYLKEAYGLTKENCVKVIQENL